MNPAWRLGVDIGGTFTDAVLEGPGARFSIKVLTTASAPDTGVIAAIEAVTRQGGIGFGDIAAVIHGTTLATNALIERKGAVTALLTTEGFRDVLEIGTESRFEQYDLDLEKPAPLVARRHRFVVPERIGADGRVLRALDEAALRSILPRLAGVESVAIAFLHSYANPAHERGAGEILRAAYPDLDISLSSEVSPEVREYERFSTTAANAYVQPLMRRYLRGLDAALRMRGVGAALLLVQSNGGLTDLDTASRFPVRLVESGPAGGAILASRIAAECGIAEAVAFDMGGTTAKFCLLDRAAPRMAREFETARAYRFKRGSGLPLRIPAIDMVEIGAGGGSLGRVVGLGLIRVGPDSAGSEPGPACYARGGIGATVTDANLVAGRIEPAAFAGGTIKLDEIAARDAVARDVAAPLAMTPETGALGIIEMVDEAMANAAREHAIENGKALEGRTLIAFGGSAPLHAARLAEKLGMTRVIVPTGAGVGSAIGFLRAPIAFEIVQSLPQKLADGDLAAVRRLLDDLMARAEGFVRRVTDVPIVKRFGGYMRYVGQRHEIPVPLAPESLASADRAALRAAFEAAYREHFGAIMPRLAIEAVSWSVSVATEDHPPGRIGESPQSSAPPPVGRRRLLDPASGEAVEAALYRRAALAPSMRLVGPAIIIEDQTSTVVPPAFCASVNALGYIVLERNAGSAA